MSNHRPGPMVSLSVCIECGNTFVVTSDQQRITPGMNLNVLERDQSIVRPLRTWVDWLDYMASRCPGCRYAEPPQQCLDNLRDTVINKYEERVKDRNSELAEDIAKLAPYGKPKMSNKPRIAAVLLGAPPPENEGELSETAAPEPEIPWTVVDNWQDVDDDWIGYSK